jgi:RND family efflux transporter MFP subunit
MTDSGKPRAAWLRDRRIIAALLLLIVAAAFIIINVRREPPAEEEAEVAEVEAETVVALVQPFELTIASLGTVEPRPGAFGRVAAPAATRVTRVLVAEGDRVRAGQPLIELDAAVFNAQVQQAEAMFAAAQRAFDRQTRLAGEGIAPRKDVEAAASELAQAQAALTEARRTQSLATLRSPLAGIVSAVDVALSQPVDIGVTLIEVIDPALLEIMFHVSPDEAARITVGTRVELTSADNAATWAGAGIVRGVSAVLDSATRSVEIRVAPTGQTRVLRVGETIGGRIVTGVHRTAIVIPAIALVPGEEGVHVFVVDAEGIAHETPVTVGERGADLVEIAAGLKGGERIVTVGAYGVSDGARVVAHIAAPAEGGS